MFIFLYGPDTYRSRQKLKEIVAHYKKIREKGLGLRYFDCGKLSLQDFREGAQQVSMFKEKKLIVLLNPFLSTEFRKELLEEEKKNQFLTKIVDSEDIILFYEDGKVFTKEPFFTFLRKYGKCQEFKLLDRQKLKNWIKKELTNYQAEIMPEALEKLIDFTGNNLWQLSNEIKKIVSYKKNKKIAVEDVKLLVKPQIETDIFKTIEAIAVKDKKRALSLLHKHIEIGDNPLYLLSMINFQFRNLLIIKDLLERGKPYYLLEKESKLHPFVVKKTYGQAQKFTLPELVKIYQKIFQIDLKIKTGQIDAQMALDLFIAEI